MTPHQLALFRSAAADVQRADELFEKIDGKLTEKIPEGTDLKRLDELLLSQELPAGEIFKLLGLCRDAICNLQTLDCLLAGNPEPKKGD
jgi:hypothetical protein